MTIAAEYLSKEIGGGGEQSVMGVVVRTHQRKKRERERLERIEKETDESPLVL